MATVLAAPSGTAHRSPEEHLDALGREMADIGKRLIARVDVLERENAKVHGQLDDACDRVHELEKTLGMLRARFEVAIGARSET